MNVRRNRRQLLFYSDIAHNHTPSYLCDDLPPSVQTRTDNRYQLRNNANLTNYRPNTETFRNSFFPFTLNTWNTTDEAIRIIDDHNILLSKIKHPIPKKNPHFYKFSRKVNIIMSRLRMNCSELKYHLYINHVSETPIRMSIIFNSQRHFTCTFSKYWSSLVFKKYSFWWHSRKYDQNFMYCSWTIYMWNTTVFYTKFMWVTLYKCFSVFCLAMLYSHRCNIVKHSVVQQMH